MRNFILNPVITYYKVISILVFKVCRMLGFDSLTGVKIESRDDLIELGSKYGGWVIPERLFSISSICYCAGCGEDITFDLKLIERYGCNIYAFDPTPRAISYVNEATKDIPKYKFFNVGLWNKKDVLKFYTPKNLEHVSHSFLNIQKTEGYIEANVDRLSDLMSSNEHVCIDLLKIDIEGSEYKVLETLVEDSVDVKVLCVEYDECFNPLDQNYKERIKKSIDGVLSFGYVMVCVQNRGNYTFVKKGLQ